MKPDSATTWRWWIKALLVILWAFFLAGGYIWAHTPVTAAVLIALSRSVDRDSRLLRVGLPPVQRHQ